MENDYCPKEREELIAQVSALMKENAELKARLKESEKIGRC